MNSAFHTDVCLFISDSALKSGWEKKKLGTLDPEKVIVPQLMLTSTLNHKMTSPTSSEGSPPLHRGGVWAYSLKALKFQDSIASHDP